MLPWAGKSLEGSGERFGGCFWSFLVGTSVEKHVLTSTYVVAHRVDATLESGWSVAVIRLKVFRAIGQVELMIGSMGDHRGSLKTIHKGG